MLSEPRQKQSKGDYSMFIEDEIEAAANVDETVEETVEQPTSPVEKVDQTKAFATRLKEEKAKAKLEAREEIAQSFGYNNWQEYVNAQTNNKLLDNGLDPDTVRPVLKDLIKEDPDYVEAMRYKAEKEALEKEIFASNSIQELNNTFGTAFKSVDELDPETIKLWNQGTPLVNAFAANNWGKLQEMAAKKAVPKDNGKAHLKTVTGSSEKAKTRNISTDEMKVFNMFGFSAEQARDYVNRTNK